MSERSFKEAFTDWWSLLQDRFGVEKPKTVAAFYYRTLEDRLTVEELDEAMGRVAYGNTYFPSPKEIVDAIQPSSADRALSEWEKVQAWVEEQDSEAIKELNDEARRIADSMGVLELQGWGNGKDLRHTRRRFLDELSEVLEDRETKAVPAPETNPKLTA